MHFSNWMIALVAVLISGCTTNAQDGQDAGAGSGSSLAPFHFTCPSCAESATWTSYGSYVFDDVGDDSTARDLVSECGWQVDGTHNGGYGNTLQVGACGADGLSVIFTWAYNGFTAYRVIDGWTGTAGAGIGLGSGLDAFLAAYPAFYQVTPELYMKAAGEGGAGSAPVKARFDANQQLVELVVGDYYQP